MPRGTKEPWFGPTRIGWGWRPVGWPGWLLTLALVLLVAAVVVAFRRSALTFVLVAGLVVLFSAIARRTSGPPGSRGRH
jgi:hypothetical protein